MNNSYITASESVTEGHPDKIADQISDAILDFVIKNDPDASVACDTLVSNGLCLICGELKTKIYAPMQEIAREVIREIGYTDASYGFDYRTAGVINAIGEQNPDHQTLKATQKMSACDQGVIYGFACDETKELMPMPIMLAHNLTKKLSESRKSGTLPYLRPDGKAQISVCYENNIPTRIDTIILSTQHSQDISLETLRKEILDEVILETIDKKLITNETKILINPAGKFIIGGPQGDAGLTGRKIIVDSYGTSVPHGGGAFSGKDPTKIDRGAAYMARYIAKNLVAAKICKKITIQLSYAIGIPNPVSIMINTHNTSKFTNKQIIKCVESIFALSPLEIVKSLNLLNPIYKKTASYGHFGREHDDFWWEKVDKIEAICDFLKA